MFGKNKILPPDSSDGLSLKVHSIFPTIQGEGPNTGQPSIFVRLSGCNLACSFCDTEFDSYKQINIQEIIQEIEKLQLQKKINPNINQAKFLIVITGGEPFRQNISPLCEALINRSYRVQIESNGTLFRKINPKVEIVCSPKVSQLQLQVSKIQASKTAKVSSPPLEKQTFYMQIREDILKQSTAIKFIISANIKCYSDIADLGQTKYQIPTYLQPMDEYNPLHNKRNIELALQLCFQHNAILSLQTHKILDID